MNSIINIKNNDKEFGYVIGVMLGDGSISKKSYILSFSSIDKEFTKIFNKNLIKIFNKKPYRCIIHVKNSKYNNKPKYKLHIYSKEIYYFLKPKLENLKWIYNQNSDFKKMVLKGLFDSEGFVDKLGSYNVNFANTDKKILELFINLCSEFKIKTKNNYGGNCPQIKILPMYIESFYRIIEGLTIKRKEQRIKKLIQRINDKKFLYEETKRLRKNGFGNMKIYRYFKKLDYNLSIGSIDGWLYCNKIPYIYKSQ
jgi:hypothetical protein